MKTLADTKEIIDRMREIANEMESSIKGKTDLTEIIIFKEDDPFSDKIWNLGNDLTNLANDDLEDDEEDDDCDELEDDDLEDDD